MCVRETKGCQQNTRWGGGGGGFYKIFQLGKQSKSQVKISSKYTLIGLIHIYSSTPKVMFTGVYYMYLANVLDNKEAHILSYSLYSVPLIISKHVQQFRRFFTQLRK